MLVHSEKQDQECPYVLADVQQIPTRIAAAVLSSDTDFDAHDVKKDQ